LFFNHLSASLICSSTSKICPYIPPAYPALLGIGVPVGNAELTKSSAAVSGFDIDGFRVTLLMPLLIVFVASFPCLIIVGAAATAAGAALAIPAPPAAVAPIPAFDGRGSCHGLCSSFGGLEVIVFIFPGQRSEAIRSKSGPACQRKEGASTRRQDSHMLFIFEFRVSFVETLKRFQFGLAFGADFIWDLCEGKCRFALWANKDFSIISLSFAESHDEHKNGYHCNPCPHFKVIFSPFPAVIIACAVANVAYHCDA